VLTPAVPPLDLGLRHRGVRAVAVVTGAALLLLALASIGPSPSGSAPDDPRWAWLARPTDVRTALGPIALDGDLDHVVARLGPPQRQELDFGGTGHRWELEGGAVLFVVADDDASTVQAVELTVPAGSPVRGALDEGLVVGSSTVDDVVRAWGPPDARGSEVDDFALRYVTCIGPMPIVLKLDSFERDAGGAARVERALVAYADEAPGTSGCTWTSGTQLAVARG
jgi:hypothetical protein